jgi:serine protease Do
MIRVAADMISGRKRFQTLHSLVLQDRVEPGSSPAIRSLVVDQTEIVSQASTAGLQRGDVITRVDDQKITNSLEFERALLGRKPGEKVVLAVLRDGTERPAELVLSSQERSSSPTDVVWKKLGLKLAPSAAESVTRVNNQFRGGLTVVDVSLEGPAARSGIQRGDILIGLHQWETLTIDNVVYVLNHPDGASFGPLKYFVIHSGEVRKGTLK